MQTSNTYDYMRQALDQLEQQGNLRRLPILKHDGRYIVTDSHRMLNLSSNDYLGLAADTDLRSKFFNALTPETFIPSSSSSRLLTGNFYIHQELETELAHLYGTEAALVFNCGYHANTGILPAVADGHTLILADKLVHASLIDGFRLSQTRYFRYRHNDMKHLEQLLMRFHSQYERIIIVTESIFSMDGDRADLKTLVKFKRKYPNVMLYLDEAHAFGVFGAHGLGCAEEEGVISDIDFLIGTFGKACASEGAFIVCNRLVREFLINRMRPFIFTTALSPICVAWTLFVLRHLPYMQSRRIRLHRLCNMLRLTLSAKGYSLNGDTQIIPLIIGSNKDTLLKAEALQRHGFYILPVRPPTVPEGTSRLRLSLRADLTDEEMETLILHLTDL